MIIDSGKERIHTAMTFDSLEEVMQTRESGVYAWHTDDRNSIMNGRPLGSDKKHL